MRLRTTLLSLVVSLLLLLLVGCGGGGGSDSSAGGCSVLNARIFGGESCNQFARSPVVAILPVAQSGELVSLLGICSGALVTVDDLLTSAHCFTEPFLAAQANGIELVGFVVVVGGLDGEVLPIVNLALHPFYDGTIGSRYDVAMATLGAVPQPAIGPLPLLLSELTGPGSRITAFGYGTNDRGELGELRSADFEVTELAPGNLIVVGDGNSSICRGDSGGPAVYVNADGVATLAGVNSFGVGDCVSVASAAFGFVDLQFSEVIDFIVGYAPDVASG